MFILEDGQNANQQPGSLGLEARLIPAQVFFEVAGIFLQMLLIFEVFGKIKFPELIEVKMLNE